MFSLGDKQFTSFEFLSFSTDGERLAAVAYRKTSEGENKGAYIWNASPLSKPCDSKQQSSK